MKKFEVLEHKADLKIRVFGRTKEELFENAMIGMFENARYEGEGEEIKREVKISSFDSLSLLVDFLNEILYLCETKREVYNQVSFEKFDSKKIEGFLFGQSLKRIGVQIKAVTYHQLNIRRSKKNLWEAVIVFDI